MSRRVLENVRQQLGSPLHIQVLGQVLLWKPRLRELQAQLVAANKQVAVLGGGRGGVTVKPGSGKGLDTCDGSGGFAEPQSWRGHTESMDSIASSTSGSPLSMPW